MNTQFAWPESVVHGSASDAAAQNTIATTYDFNTGLVKTATDTNGRVSQTTYDSGSLRPISQFSSTNSFAYHEYDDEEMIISDVVYESGQSGSNYASRGR